MGGGLRERFASQRAEGNSISSILVPGLIVVGLALIVFGMLATRRRRTRHMRRDTPPPLVFPATRGKARPSRTPPGRTPPVRTPPANGPADPGTPAARSDEPVQLLPGRLQIVEGMNRGQDIRFPRTPGEIPTITIGRDSGPPERHVRLQASTVSQLHARMQFEDGRWRITNLSATNPLVLNGEELPATGGSRLLDEGDRIEIGEVVLCFREV